MAEEKRVSQIPYTYTSRSGTVAPDGFLTLFPTGNGKASIHCYYEDIRVTRQSIVEAEDGTEKYKATFLDGDRAAIREVAAIVAINPRQAEILIEQLQEYVDWAKKELNYNGGDE